MRKDKDFNNVYISYEKTQRRRRGGKGWKVFLVVLLAATLGIGTFLLVSKQIDLDKYYNQDDLISTDNELGEEDAEVEVTPDPTPEVTPQPTAEAKVEKEEDPRTPVRVKGLYVSAPVASNEDKINALIEVAESTEINALVIDVKDDDGRITYAMDSEFAESIGATTNVINDMEALVKRLKDKDIYTIARIVAFKDPHLAESRHDLAIKNRDGSIYRDTNGESWVNPYLHEVWNYLIEVSEQAAYIGFDEIQFDYIRFSTGRGMSEVDFGEGSEEKDKEDIILEFTKYAYDKLKPLGVFVSADVYGAIITSSIDAGLVGQNYVEMSKHLDYICPMIYPSHYGDGNYGIEYPDLEPYKLIRRALEDSQKRLDVIPEGEHRAIVRPWLQDFTASWLQDHKYKSYGPLEIRDQIGGVYAAGYKEWLFWNASGNYTIEGFNEE